MIDDSFAAQAGVGSPNATDNDDRPGVQAEGFRDTNTIQRGDCAEVEATEQGEKDFVALRARFALAVYSLAPSMRQGSQRPILGYALGRRSTSRHPSSGRGVRLACRSSGMHRQRLDAKARRFRLRAGQALTSDNVRDPWRPSGTVSSASIFAVMWTARSGVLWTALPDFEPADQLRVFDACRNLDRQAAFLGAWPRGRFD